MRSCQLIARGCKSLEMESSRSVLSAENVTMSNSFFVRILLIALLYRFRPMLIWGSVYNHANEFGRRRERPSRLAVITSALTRDSVDDEAAIENGDCAKWHVFPSARTVLLMFLARVTVYHVSPIHWMGWASEVRLQQVLDIDFNKTCYRCNGFTMGKSGGIVLRFRNIAILYVKPISFLKLLKNVFDKNRIEK